MSCYSTRNESSRQLRETCGGVGFVNTFDRSHGKIRCCREYQKAGEERTCSTSHTDEPCCEPVQARDWDGVRPIRVPSPCSLWSRRKTDVPVGGAVLAIHASRSGGTPFRSCDVAVRTTVFGDRCASCSSSWRSGPFGKSGSTLSLVLDHRPSTRGTH